MYKIDSTTRGKINKSSYEEQKIKRSIRKNPKTIQIEAKKNIVK